MTMDPTFFSSVTKDLAFALHQTSYFPQIIAADIQRSRQNSFYHTCTRYVLSLGRNHAARSGIPPEFIIQQPSIAEHKQLPSTIQDGFFGVPPTYFSSATKARQIHSLLHLMRWYEQRSRKRPNLPMQSRRPKLKLLEMPKTQKKGKRIYSWWDVLLGRHDQEIFEQSTAHPDNHKGMRATAVGYFYSGLTSTLHESLIFLTGNWQ